MMELSIIIVKYRAEEEYKACVRELKLKKNWELITIDNNKVNLGLGAACNIASKKSKGKYLLFLNPDCVVQRDAITQMIEFLRTHEEVGIVGPQLLDENNKPHLSFSEQATPLSALVAYSFIDKLVPNNSISKKFWHRGQSLNESKEVGGVSGACMMMRKSDFLKLGGFDKKFFMYFEETDLCRRMKDMGKKVYFLAKAHVKHLGGKSGLDNKSDREEWFRNSRWNFFMKHFGFLKAAMVESFLVIGEEWRMLLVLLLATFLRFYRLSELMPMIGDQALDFLQALNSLDHKELPLLGIPSSVPRFKQGPIYIWWMMLLFSLFGRDPVVVGYGAAFLSLAAVLYTALLVRKYWGRNAALVAAIIMASGNLIVTQGRMAFHTNAIPLASLFFIDRLVRKPKKLIDWFFLTLSFCFLFQFELAVFPLIFLVLLYAYRFRKYLNIKAKLLLGLGAIVGLWPQIVFDITHQFKQLGLFFVWVVYRIVSLVGITDEHKFTTGNILVAGERFLSYGRKTLAWGSFGLSVLMGGLLVVSMGFIGRFWKNTDQLARVCFLWILLQGVSYIAHGGPSEAYFPVLFVPVAMLLGYYVLIFKGIWQRAFIAFIVIVAIFNSIYIVKHDFMVNTENSIGAWSVHRYGLPLITIRKHVELIKKWVDNKPIILNAMGPGSEFPSFIDHYRYLFNLEKYPMGTSDAVNVWILVGEAATNSGLINTKIYRMDGMAIGIQK